MAAARVSGEETPREVGDRVRDALNARHGRRVDTILGPIVHHG